MKYIQKQKHNQFRNVCSFVLHVVENVTISHQVCGYRNLHGCATYKRPKFTSKRNFFCWFCFLLHTMALIHHCTLVVSSVRTGNSFLLSSLAWRCISTVAGPPVSPFQCSTGRWSFQLCISASG